MNRGHQAQEFKKENWVLCLTFKERKLMKLYPLYLKKKKKKRRTYQNSLTNICISIFLTFFNNLYIFFKKRFL